MALARRRKSVFQPEPDWGSTHNRLRGILVGLVVAFIAHLTVSELVQDAVWYGFAIPGALWTPSHFPIWNDLRGHASTIAHGLVWLSRWATTVFFFVVGYQGSVKIPLFDIAGRLLGTHVAHPGHHPKNRIPDLPDEMHEGMPLARRNQFLRVLEWLVVAAIVFVGGAYIYHRLGILDDVVNMLVRATEAQFEEIGIDDLVHLDTDALLEEAPQQTGSFQEVVDKIKRARWRPEGKYLFPLQPLSNGRKYVVTSGYYSVRPKAGGGTRRHNAFDIFPPRDSTRAEDFVVYAAKGGVVHYTSVGNGCGDGMIITHPDGGSELYCHMAQGSRKVANGQVVTAGTAIGLMGDTGTVSCGPGRDCRHLHFASRDPQGLPVPQEDLVLDCSDGSEVKLTPRSTIGCDNT